MNEPSLAPLPLDLQLPSIFRLKKFETTDNIIIKKLSCL